MSTITNIIQKLRLFVQEHIRGTRLGDGIVSFFKALGVNDLFTRILYAKDRKEPTKDMQEAEAFFTAHKQELNDVAALFADELSREVYFGAVKFRKTHNPKDVPVYSAKDQYFVNGIVSLSNREVFIDCGAYDGDTLKEFIRFSKGQYQSVVCFEPVEEYISKLKKRGNVKNLTAICAGVYKETTTLHFNAEAGKGSAISTSTENTITVPVRAIDETPECKSATFIKMDVEGSELDALLGARETILHNKPKLAICIYHKHQDFIDIPVWIHQLVPEYRLYVRHHAFSTDETVLYAIPPEK